MSRHAWLGACVPLAAVAMPAAANAAGPLEIVSTVMAEQRVRAPDGSTRIVLAAAHKVVPGDRIVFVLSYRNTGGRPLVNLVFDNPLSADIAYRGGAADSPAPDVSIDGKTFGPLASLRTAGPAGAARAATPDDVTHVRWRLTAPLAAGAQGRVAFQGVLR